MSLKTLVTVLILGSSSVALAKPILIRDHRNDVTQTVTGGHYDTIDYYNDHQKEFDNDRGRRFMRRPITVANHVVLSNDIRRSTLIRLDERMGGFKKLRFDMHAGRTYIDTIVLQLSDGHTQTVTIRQMLSRENPALVINLDHPGVRSIQVFGSSMRGRGSFDVVALRAPRFARRGV